MSTFSLLSSVGLFIFFSQIVLSSQDQNYGLGGDSTGQVGSGAADLENPFAAIYNPSLIAQQKKTYFSFSTAAISVKHSSIQNATLDTPHYRTEKGEYQKGDFRLPTHQQTLWAVGLTYPFALTKERNRFAGFGIVTSGPFNLLRSYSALTPYDFSSLRYGNSDSQFKTTLSTAIEIIPQHLSFGAGLSLFLTTSGVSDAHITNDNPTARMAFNIGFNTALVTGVLASWADTYASLVFRQKINPTFEHSIDGKIEVAGTPTLTQPILLETSLYYEPQIIDLEFQQSFFWGKLAVGIAHHTWTGFKPAFVRVETIDSSGARKATEIPSVSMRNTLNPRLSVKIPLWEDHLVFSAGYQYQPTPLLDVSGDHNLIDANTHRIGASVSYRFKRQQLLDFPVRMGVFGQIHWLIPRKIEKSSPDFVGAPGYTYSANASVYGVFVEAEL